MALAEMKRVSVLIPRRDHESLLKTLQRFGCVQMTEVNKAETELPPSESLKAGSLEEQRDQLHWTINRLSRYDKEKKSMFIPLPAVEGEALLQEDHHQAMELVSRVERLERQSGDLRGEEARLRQQQEQLSPWLEMDIPFSRLKDTSSCRLFLGTAPGRGLALLSEEWADRPVVIRRFGSIRESDSVLALSHAAEEFHQALKGIGFQQAVPGTGEETARTQLMRVNEALDAIEKKKKEIVREMDLAAAHLPQLRVSYEALNAGKARADAHSKMAHTASASLMSGWVPARAAEAVSARIREEFPDAQVALALPEEGEEPPVLLDNPALVSPYESVVSGFALPAPGAVDPTAVMMPFFACFFGMMVSDAGYGLMMAILIPILVRIMKPSQGARKLFWILAGGGVMTVVWGALYNTWFGFAPWPSVFDPVNNSLPVMAVCIGVGALHLFSGLGLGMVQNIRNGKPLDALFDQVSWMLLVIGLGLLVLPQTAEAGKWMAIAGAGIILLTAGRNKSKNPVKRLLSGLGALYGVTGWISDLLSYMRLFGMGLATGVIGMVINQLVGMVMSGGIIGIVIGAVIFVGAHLFNAAINILGAYVHACRLQYIEFFGKFFQEGGKPFTPLRFAPRYVRLNDTRQGYSSQVGTIPHVGGITQ